MTFAFMCLGSRLACISRRGIRVVFGACLTPLSAFAPNAIEEESHDHKIEKEHQDFCHTWMAAELVDFDWDKRAGDDYGEPLSPTFQKPETNSLRQEESRVNKAANFEILDPTRSKRSGFQNDTTYVPAARA